MAHMTLVTGDPCPEFLRPAITRWVGVVNIIVPTVGSAVALGLILIGVIE